MGAKTPSDDQIDDENLEKLSAEERARLFWAASQAKRLKPSNEPMRNVGNTKGPDQNGTGGEPFVPYDESDKPGSNVISMSDRFGRASARKKGANDLKSSSNAPDDKWKKRREKMGLGLGGAKDPGTETDAAENRTNQLPQGDNNIVDFQEPDFIPKGPTVQRVEEGDENEVAADMEADKARKRARTNELNGALSPVGNVLSLKNFRQIREIQKTIKKIAERIQKNNKEIKKLRPPTLLKKTFMYTGRALLDLVTVGTSETIITPVQIVQSLKQQDNKLKANKLRNINKELANQIKKLELQIYNLQNVLKMEEADEPASSAESKK